MRDDGLTSAEGEVFAALRHAASGFGQLPEQHHLSAESSVMQFIAAKSCWQSELHDGITPRLAY